MRQWLQALPDEVVRARPALSVGYAAALMVSGDVAEVERRLRDAERRLAFATLGIGRHRASTDARALQWALERLAA